MRREASQFSLILRSVLFTSICSVFTVTYPVIVSVFCWLPRKPLFMIAASHFNTIRWFEKHILNLTYEIVDKHHMPKGPCIIAMKHQSFWETLKILDLSDVPVIVYKQSLHWIPGFGWFLKFLGMIGIDRSKGVTALQQILGKSKVAFDEGRQLIVFPEGTRVPIGEKRPYKYGVAAIYAAHNVPIVPVALNSGLNWPKNGFLKYPGKITMKVLKPIQPGLPPKEMLKKLEKMIETESEKLLKC